MGLSRLATACRKCPYASTCGHKQLEALGYMEPLAAAAAAPITEPIAAQMAVKHDFRQVKVAPGTTVTIDLEELKARMVADIYRSAGLGFLQPGG